MPHLQQPVGAVDALDREALGAAALLNCDWSALEARAAVGGGPAQAQLKSKGTALLRVCLG